LLLIDGTEDVVAEAVAPVHTLTSPVGVQFGALGQPHFHISVFESHWAIFHHCAIGKEADFGSVFTRSVSMRTI